MREETPLRTQNDIRRALSRAHRLAANLSDEADQKLVSAYILELEQLLATLWSGHRYAD